MQRFKKILATGALAALMGAGVAVATASPAAAYVRCDGWGRCWHVRPYGYYGYYGPAYYGYPGGYYGDDYYGDDYYGGGPYYGGPAISLGFGFGGGWGGHGHFHGGGGHFGGHHH